MYIMSRIFYRPRQRQLLIKRSLIAAYLPLFIVMIDLYAFVRRPTKQNDYFVGHDV